MVAGVGFEPHDLRVMSPTSYQAALLRAVKLLVYITIFVFNCQQFLSLFSKKIIFLFSALSLVNFAVNCYNNYII